MISKINLATTPLVPVMLAFPPLLPQHLLRLRRLLVFPQRQQGQLLQPVQLLLLVQLLLQQLGLLLRQRVLLRLLERPLLLVLVKLL